MSIEDKTEIYYMYRKELKRQTRFLISKTIDEYATKPRVRLQTILWLYSTNVGGSINVGICRKELIHYLQYHSLNLMANIWILLVDM